MNKIGIIVGAIILIFVIAIAAYYFTNIYVPSLTTLGATTTVYTNASISSYSTTIIPSNTTTSIAYTIKFDNSSTYGTYLVNASGFTLYTYSGDVPNSGLSTCTGGCANIWPPFYITNLILQPGLSTSNFSTIIRSDGSKQLGYKGLPLYLYTGDTKPGEVSGNNIAGFKVATK